MTKLATTNIIHLVLAKRMQEDPLSDNYKPNDAQVKVIGYKTMRLRKFISIGCSNLHCRIPLKKFK